MPVTSGSEIYGFLEEELETMFQIASLSSGLIPGSDLKHYLPYPRTQVYSHGNGNDLLLENWTAILQLKM